MTLFERLGKTVTIRYAVWISTAFTVGFISVMRVHTATFAEVVFTCWLYLGVLLISELLVKKISGGRV